MTNPGPSLLHVSEHATGEVRPRAAYVHVTLTASKLFSGRAALTKSEELRRLVEALAERGVGEQAVALDGASIDVSTGLFTRSSSVTYRVRVHLRDLDLVAGVLEVIAAAKQATLTHITWDHGGGANEELIAECAARAAAKARRLATALGVTLGDIHDVHADEPAEPPRVESYAAGDIMRMRMVSASKTSISHELAGLELAPTKQVTVHVRVAYRLSPGSRAVL